jgi:hypothetical protein
MKKIIILIIIAALGYEGFLFFKQRSAASQTIVAAPKSDLILSPIKTPSNPTTSSFEAQVEGVKISEPALERLSNNTVPPPIPSEELASPQKKPKIAEEAPSLQIIRGIITFEEGLLPIDYILKVGMPARFIIDPKDDIEGCMSTIMIPELYEEFSFVKAGQRIIMEFTPEKTGDYYITCAMGEAWGLIKVVK